MGGGGWRFWIEQIGPFYDANGVRSLTRLSRDDLWARVAANEILVVRAIDGTDLFPSFQFDHDGKLLGSVNEVARLLEPISDSSWDIALWLNTPTRRFGGRTAAEELRVGHVADVLRWAERDGKILDH
jgi:hypothetical protein